MLLRRNRFAKIRCARSARTRYRIDPNALRFSDRKGRYAQDDRFFNKRRRTKRHAARLPASYRQTKIISRNEDAEPLYFYRAESRQRLSLFNEIPCRASGRQISQKEKSHFAVYEKAPRYGVPPPFKRTRSRCAFGRKRVV